MNTSSNYSTSYHNIDGYEDRSGLDNLASVAESLMYSDQHIPSEMAASQSSQPDSIISNYSFNDNYTHNRKRSNHSDDLITPDDDNDDADNDHDDFSTESEDGLPEPGTKRKQVSTIQSNTFAYYLTVITVG
jgi:hypothetical protein